MRDIPYFELKRDAAVITAIMRGKLPSEPDLSKPVYGDLWNICKGCWAEHPQARPSMSRLVGKLKLLQVPIIKPLADVIDEIPGAPQARTASHLAERLEQFRFLAEDPKVKYDLQVELVHTLQPDGGVYSVRFSPDGQYLATCSYYKARIYDAQTGVMSCSLEHAVRLSTVRFSPDGKLLATGGETKNIRVYLTVYASSLMMVL